MPAPLHLLGAKPYPCGCGRTLGLRRALHDAGGPALPAGREAAGATRPPAGEVDRRAEGEGAGAARPAQKGDALAVELFDFQARAMGCTSRTWCMALDPEFVVIGGGLMDPESTTEAFRERYLKIVGETARPYLWPVQRERLHDPAVDAGRAVAGDRRGAGRPLQRPQPRPARRLGGRFAASFARQLGNSVPIRSAAQAAGREVGRPVLRREPRTAPDYQRLPALSVRSVAWPAGTRCPTPPSPARRSHRRLPRGAAPSPARLRFSAVTVGPRARPRPACARSDGPCRARRSPGNRCRRRWPRSRGWSWSGRSPPLSSSAPSIGIGERDGRRARRAAARELQVARRRRRASSLQLVGAVDACRARCSRRSCSRASTPVSPPKRPSPWLPAIVQFVNVPVMPFANQTPPRLSALLFARW